MRWRPFTWLLLSVFFFVASAYFWHLGDEWAAKKSGSSPLLSTNPPEPPKPTPKPAAHLAIPLLSQPGNLNAASLTPATNNSAQNKFPNRLSNTTRPLNELVHSDKAILLENALLDTEHSSTLAIPEHLRAHGAPGSYIVQARQPIDNAFRAALVQAGADFVSYVPNNAYLVTASPDAASRLAADPLIQTVLAWEPYYKLQLSLLNLAVQKQPLPDNTALNLLLFPGAREKTIPELQRLQTEVLREDRSPFGPVLTVRAPSGAETLPALAGLPGIQRIEPARTRLPANDLSRALLGVATNTVATNNYLDLTGSNVLVQVNDTGIDATHPDLLAPRIFGNVASSLNDVDGHGTHVAGIIAGSGAQSTNINNALGSIMPASPFQFRGKAPAAKLFSVSFAPLNGVSLSDSALQETAARTNAFISNNSWNYVGTDAQSYDIAAASYDAAVRDALPRVSGSQPVLFVFSAGNLGGAADDTGNGGIGDTIQSPATAKNVITVGATELPRNITNLVVFNCTTSGTNTTCDTNTPWAGMTDSSDQVASFSSRGNVGAGIEGDSGRFKPDVLAPGTFVVSTRSSQWDQQSYYSRHDIQFFSDVSLGPKAFDLSEIFVPANATQFQLTVYTNSSSPVPFPGVTLYVSKNTPPSPTNYDFRGINQLTIALPALSPLDQTWFFGFQNNSTNQTIDFNLKADITFTNAGDDAYFGVLKTNLNDALETNGPPHYYRYESGTSMAAGDVSGSLALMQDFLQNRLSHTDAAGHLTNSPALMKAMLINGSRPVGQTSQLYNYEVTNTLNIQGWGMVNVSNTLHGGLAATTTTNSMFLFDEAGAQGLATGQSRSYQFQLTPFGQNQPLRITLVWTDPPGNPAASTKLVNDLDLVVTNSDPNDVDFGDIFRGNDFLSGSFFTLPTDTNAPNIDVINNVENVFLAPPLSSSYTITVVGRRVNVNAVTAHPDNVVQDYALVVSSGDGDITNALTLVTTNFSSVNVPLVTTITNSFGGDPHNFGSIITRQHVGADSPLLGTNEIAYPTDANAVITLGVNNQWHFYLIQNTNDSNFTNAAFATFAPPNLATPVMGTREGEEGTNSSRLEADIDLYVSTDLTLTNLSPGALSGAFKSVSRGGTETIILSNAIPSGTYYIAIKSEDQRSAEYSLAALFSNEPFSTTDTNGNPILRGVPAPAPIPDAGTLRPGSATILAFSPRPSMLLHRVIVTNVLTHQLMSDLYGALTHQGERNSVVLNNHSLGIGVTNAIFIYDDSTEANVPGAQHTDGPGSLHDFAGKQSGQQWQLTMTDNQKNHIGTNVALFIFLEKQQDLTAGITALLNPGACREDFIVVPADVTNLTVKLSLLSGTGPLSLQICPADGSGPCKSNFVNSAGSILSYDLNDVPPLHGGTYLVRTCNLGSDVANIHLIAELDIGAGVPVTQTFNLTNPVPILDDAVVTITNFINSHFQISSLDVGLLLKHPRVSDLAITLISPDGTRILLFENRGALSTTGLGTFSSTTNSLGLPVFAVTNMAPFYTNDFEEAAVGAYTPGAVFQGWNVLNKQVEVVRDLNDLCLSNNVLVLGEGSVSNALPTTNSTSYNLSFKVTHAPFIIGMVGWWPFDEDATDIWGGHDGTLCGNPQFRPGEVLSAYQGDGIATSITVQRCPELDLGQKPGFTIEGWINPANITNPAPLVEWNDVQTTNQGLQFWLSANFSGLGGPGSLSANLWDTNSQPHPIDTAPVVTNAGWQHVAMSFDSATLTARFYVNGQLALSQAIPATNLVPRTSGDLYFGYHAAPAVAGTVSFQGGLDEFSVYERALCDCEISAIAGVTNRGKYDDNVLTWPVTNFVRIDGLPLMRFVNGTNWSVTGPQWETNTISFANSTFAPTGIRILPFGCPGAALDDFVLSSMVTNFFDGLLHFTDNTNIAPVPIKFAPAPYAISNFPPTLVFSNNFANAALGVFNPGTSLAGSLNDITIGQRNWLVTNGPVAVITNGDGQAIGSNVVALAGGAVQSELPTIPGHKYQVAYSVRGPCAAGFWNGNPNPLSRRAQDVIGGNDGAFFNLATNAGGFLSFVGNNSLFFPGMLEHGAPGIPDLASKIELGDPENLRFTNSLSIEAWVRPMPQTNAYILGLVNAGAEEQVIEQIFFRGDSRHCLDPYYLALEQSDPTTFGLLFHIEDANSTSCGLTLEAENVVKVGQWAHVAAVFERNVQWTANPPWPTNQLRLYVNGQRMTNLLVHPIEAGFIDGFTSISPFGDLDPAFSPGAAIGNRSRSEASEPFCGFMDEVTVYDRALTDPEVAAIYNAGTEGKADTAAQPSFSLAKVRALVDDAPLDIGFGDNASWTVHTFSFVAVRTNSVLRLESMLPGSEVDNITLTEMPNELSYQPEEALSQLNGQDAFGAWRLEIWDDRVGATNDLAQLIDWQLAFQLQPSNPPPVITLSHCVPYQSTLPPGGIQYFIVPVPQWATMATNILSFATQHGTTTPMPVNVLFNPTNFPGAADLALFGGPSSGATKLMTASSVPPVVIGQPYFLAVTNANAFPVDFSVAVCFDVATLANCQPTPGFVTQAGIPRYFAFDMPTNVVPPGYPPQETTFLLSGANSNLTVVLSEHLPLPDLSHYDYISAAPCTNDEIVVVFTNSTPFPIQTNRWYVGIFSSAPTAVPFTVETCYKTNYPALIPLTNNVPYGAGFGSPYVAPPGPPRWFFYEFSVTNSVSGILFELYNLSGDADLVLQKDLPPGEPPYFDGSFNMGTTPEQIVVRSSYAMPDLRGNWFLGVYNNELNNVAYTIRAQTPDTNGFLVTALPHNLSFSPMAPPHGILLQWNAVVGETYLIQFTTTLNPANWVTIGTNTATTACPTFELPAGTSGFTRLVQIAPVPIIQPRLSIKLWPGNQVRISWPVTSPGFTLQYASSPLGPWINVPAPVVIEGAEYVVYDLIGPNPRFYRLFR